MKILLIAIPSILGVLVYLRLRANRIDNPLGSFLKDEPARWRKMIRDEEEQKHGNGWL